MTKVVPKCRPGTRGRATGACPSRRISQQVRPRAVADRTSAALALALAEVAIMPARIPGDLILEAEGERLEQWLHGVGGADLVLALLEAREESKDSKQI